MPRSRRKFLQIAGLATAGSGLSVAACAAEPIRGAFEPDFIVLNAKVYTVDSSQPTAESFAIDDGRFVAVGTSDSIELLAGANTTILDADGCTVVPGFIDAHSHPAYAGLYAAIAVDANLPSIAQIQQALRTRAMALPPGEWVIGYKYDDTKTLEGRKLTRDDLDEVSTEHPVYVQHRGGHTVYVNSLALKLAKINDFTPNPRGGEFVRDNRGRVTGLITGLAGSVFDDSLRSLAPSERALQAGIHAIGKEMSAAGLTSVHEAGTDALAMRAYQSAHDAGALQFRAYILVNPEVYQYLKGAGVRTGMGDPMLRLGSVKFSADGSVSERTMRMSEPYLGRPDDYGQLTMTQSEIDEAVMDAHRNGFQIGIHANGDVAIDMVLNAYERAQEICFRPDPRHRIEHCTLINPRLLARIRSVGAIPTPFYTYVHFHGEKWAEYGQERLESMFAHRSFLDHGIPVAGASDYIPGPFEPLMAIQSMVTRKDANGIVWGRNQRVSVTEALRICTLNGAYASFEEDIKGSISVGKLADFVVLSDDPHVVDPDSIKSIRVLRTVLGGRTTYSTN